MAGSRTILFAGGGTGGHIYPNLAIAQRLAMLRPDMQAHYIVSNRQVDARILDKEGQPRTALPALPLSLHPRKLYAFYQAFQASRRLMRQLIQDIKPLAMVATGGFVSGPAVQAAREMKLPVIMLNLDAVPGKANRWIARRASDLYTVHPHASLPGRAKVVGLPLRLTAIGPRDRRQARIDLGMKPDKPMLLVTGASQGAESINRMMIELATLAPGRQALLRWQILHLAGSQGVDELKAAYAHFQLDAQVEIFCNQMGRAWRGASIAISRSGAGSVAEAWANATPTIFLPYPHHRDQHQKLNALPLVEAGAAVMLPDLIDPLANARQVTGPLLALMGNDAQRQKMVDVMEADPPEDGAMTLARHLATLGPAVSSSVDPR